VIEEYKKEIGKYDIHKKCRQVEVPDQEVKELNALGKERKECL